LEVEHEGRLGHFLAGDRQRQKTDQATKDGEEAPNANQRLPHG
jgi:hypothetical protein